MSLDRDYPLSPTQVKVTLVGLLVLGGVFAALFGGFIPGLKPNYTPPATLQIEGESFYYTTVTLAPPAVLQNHTVPQTYWFHNVSYTLWVTNWGGFSGGIVRGNGTETNGTLFSFALGQSASPPVNATVYVTPDHAVGVYWPGGILGGPRVWLLARA